jgi:hypothetical protein
MKVADLQQHLAELARLLEAAGTKKGVVSDLEALREGLEPFREQTLRDLAGLLQRVGRSEESADGGGKKKTRAPKASAASSPVAEELTRQTRDLYELAASPAVTEEQIDALADQLRDLSGAELVGVAAAIGLKVAKSSSKSATVKAIRKRIVDRKGASQLASLVDRDFQQDGAGGGN